ncbi:MAG: aspartate kinase [Bacteroidetes bacterium]|nr:aspartate kinase [Bacteroidota bacterium]
MEIRVFKFGGASINDATGVRNVLSILRMYPSTPVLAVISAMGKTTNALEQLLSYYIARDPVLMIEAFHKIYQYHMDIVRDLFPSRNHPVYTHLDNLFDQMKGHLKRGHLTPGLKLDYDFEYDQVVCYGELFSTAIVNHFLVASGIHSTLFDARDLVKTNSRYRDARVDWKLTQNNVRDNIENYFLTGSQKGKVAITQGFIASDGENNSTTLGREGSDYSAAIFAYSLKTRELTIWKDVPGILNADPKWFDKPKKLTRLSYQEAIELAYFGASVIHPKTIKPLENANIVLHVKSFLKPDAAGTTVENLQTWNVPSPIFIRKQNQVLLSISPKDFSFIMEENLSQIFRILAKHKVKVNVMQNSAISFSICVDGDQLMGSRCIKALQKSYSVRYNDNLELFTIRHYTLAAISRIVNKRKVLLEQKTRNTVHLVLK